MRERKECVCVSERERERERKKEHRNTYFLSAVILSKRGREICVLCETFRDRDGKGKIEGNEIGDEK